MRRMFVLVVFALLASSVSAFAQNISCTDASNTNCTIKKNQPFAATHDPADPGDTIATEKWRLYLDGVRVAEQVAIPGTSPVYAFAAGLSVTGDHTIYAEAIGTAYDISGAPSEVASGPSNVVTVHIVTGSLSSPKNTHVVK